MLEGVPSEGGGVRGKSSERGRVPISVRSWLGDGFVGASLFYFIFLSSGVWGKIKL